MNPFKRFLLPLAWIVPAIAGVMAVPFILFGEQFRINWGLITALFALHWVVICYLLYIIWEPKTSHYESPRAVKLDVLERMLLVRAAGWLGQDVGVSVFETSDGFERQLALGSVYNVQQDGLVQIRLYPFLDDPEGAELSARLAQVNAAGLADVIIKPGPLRMAG